MLVPSYACEHRCFASCDDDEQSLIGTKWTPRSSQNLISAILTVSRTSGTESSSLKKYSLVLAQPIVTEWVLAISNATV